MPTLRSLRLISRWQVHRLTTGAKRGNLVDGYNLALTLERLGRDTEAEHWYRTFADQDVDSMCNLGLLLARTDREGDAIVYLVRGAETGDAECAYNAGAVYQDIGALENARHWYATAASRGHVGAATSLRQLNRTHGTL